MSARSRVGAFLRKYADRLDPDGAPRAIGWSFTFELHEGIRFRQDGRGCSLWYLGQIGDEDKAYTESDTRPPWIDWGTMTLREYPKGRN